MKTNTLFGFRGSLVFTILFFFNTEGLLSQQVIKLKNGERYIANIKSHSGDTLVYQLFSKPKVSQWVLMNEVENIKNLSTGRKIYLEDTIPDIRKEEIYYQSRELRNLGVGFVIGGAVVTGFGLALLIPAASEYHIFSKSSSPEWAHDQLISGVIVTTIGGAGLLTGIILSTVGGSKMKIFSIKHHGISVDFNSTPGQQGLSFVCRF
jgi:hypothetical protein